MEVNDVSGTAEALVKTVNEQGWSLQELAPHGTSLEDLFIKLTPDGIKPRAKPKPARVEEVAS